MRLFSIALTFARSSKSEAYGSLSVVGFVDLALSAAAERYSSPSVGGGTFADASL